MKSFFYSIILLLAYSVIGCHSLPTQGFLPEFSEGEIRSKTWDDGAGHRLVFLAWSEVHLKRGSDLIIVKYGREGGLFTNAVDFYKVTSLPNRQFGLLYHDSGRGSSITAINLRDSPKETVIDIQREGLPGTTANIAGQTISQPRSFYSIAYESDDTVRPPMEIFMGGDP